MWWTDRQTDTAWQHKPHWSIASHGRNAGCLAILISNVSFGSKWGRNNQKFRQHQQIAFSNSVVWSAANSSALLCVSFLKIVHCYAIWPVPLVRNKQCMLTWGFSMAGLWITSYHQTFSTNDSFKIQMLSEINSSSLFRNFPLNLVKNCLVTWLLQSGMDYVLTSDFQPLLTPSNAVWKLIHTYQCWQWLPAPLIQFHCRTNTYNNNNNNNARLWSVI